MDCEAFEELQGQLGEIFGDILKLYVTTSTRLVQELRDVVSNQDIATVEHSAHSLKGCSSQIGATGLSECAGELENLARSGTLTGAEDLLKTIEARNSETLEFLSQRGFVDN